MIIDMCYFFEHLSRYLNGEFDWDYIERLCEPLNLPDDYKEEYIKKGRLHRILYPKTPLKRTRKKQSLKTR